MADRLEHLDRKASAAEGDACVLEVAGRSDGLVCDDLTLGRRARSLGGRWIRIGDLVVPLVRAGRLTPGRGRSAIVALGEAGRMDEVSARDHLKELK